MPDASAGGRQEAYRWRLTSYSSVASIYVIEPPKEPKDDEPAERGRRVPFGFGRVLDAGEPVPDRDPQLWEGDGA